MFYFHKHKQLHLFFPCYITQVNDSNFEIRLIEESDNVSLNPLNQVNHSNSTQKNEKQKFGRALSLNPFTQVNDSNNDQMWRPITKWFPSLNPFTQV